MIQKDSFNKEAIEFLQLKARLLPQAWRSRPPWFSECSGQERVLENKGGCMNVSHHHFLLNSQSGGGLENSSRSGVPCVMCRKGAPGWEL